MTLPDVSLRHEPRPGLGELAEYLAGRYGRDQRQTERVVELGGDLPMLQMLRSVAPEATIVSVLRDPDHRLGPFSSPADTYDPQPGDALNVATLQMDSHRVSTVAAAFQLLGTEEAPEPPDLLVIESDFSYAGVLVDVGRWSLHVNGGTIVVVAGIGDPTAGAGYFWANELGVVWYAKQEFGNYGLVIRT